LATILKTGFLKVPNLVPESRSSMTMPEAIDSPRPQLASMTTWSFLLIGSTVNMIPEETASTMLWTTTAIPMAVWSTLRS
jgi:hypothetical protein